MTQFTPKELLNHLLEGNTLTGDELEQFIRDNSLEGELLEYKNGDLTKNHKDGRQTIRKCVSGFANSNGGVLIIGIDEPENPDEPRKIAPCQRNIGRQSLIEWADHCLQGMVGSFSPLPRILPIEHKEGPVLMIAVARAPSYIQCEESGEWKYFLRLGASTIAAPAYLITDLVLGRRQHPLLDLHPAASEANPVELPGRHPGHRIDVWRRGFQFTVENLSLTTADEVAMGVIAWSLVEGETGELNRHLRLYLDEIPPSPPFADLAPKVIHCSSLSYDLSVRIAPFHIERLPAIRYFNLPRRIPIRATCAAYVLAKGAPPIWFQLEFPSLPGGISDKDDPPHLKPVIIPKGLERPKVAWELASMPYQPS